MKVQYILACYSSPCSPLGLHVSGVDSSKPRHRGQGVEEESLVGHHGDWTSEASSDVCT